jgi:hypothetical protein
MQAFRDTADHVLSRHHRAFLGAFKQMMVAVFGQAWSRCSVRHPFKVAPWRWVSPVLNHHCRASQPSLLRRALGAKLSSLPHKALEVSQFNSRCRPQEDDQSSHHRRAARVTCATAEPVPAHVRGVGIRLAWSPACFRLQDFSSKQQAAEEFVRRRLP